MHMRSVCVHVVNNCCMTHVAQEMHCFLTATCCIRVTRTRQRTNAGRSCVRTIELTMTRCTNITTPTTRPSTRYVVMTTYPSPLLQWRLRAFTVYIYVQFYCMFIFTCRYQTTQCIRAVTMTTWVVRNSWTPPKTRRWRPTSLMPIIIKAALWLVNACQWAVLIGWFKSFSLSLCICCNQMFDWWILIYCNNFLRPLKR